MDSFIFARSAPPVDIVGEPSLLLVLPSPLARTSIPECLLNSLGRNILAARFSIARLSRRHPLDSREISDAMCCEVLAPGKLTCQRREIFISPRRWTSFSGRSSSTSSTIQNFGSPINLLTSPLFGHSTQTLANSLGSGGANGGLNPLYQIGGPRSIQFALKLQF